MSQLAADALKLPVHQIRVDLGDSRFLNAPISGGSQTAASVGPAVLAAADSAKEKLFALALADKRSQLVGFSVADLALDDGFVLVREAPHLRVSVPGAA